MSDERKRTPGIERLTDQDRKAYEEEIGPLIDQLQAVTEKHGYAGVATIQFGYRIDPAERRSSWTLGHFLLNTGRLATQADHRRKRYPRGFSSLQEAKDYFERTGHQPASPLLVALVGLMRGYIDPERVLRSERSRSDARATVERLLATDGLNLTPTQRRKLRRSLRLDPEPPTEKHEEGPTYAAEFGPHGELIGFRNLATGELDDFGGSDPEDDPPS